MQEKEVIIKTIVKNFDDKIKAGILWYTFITNINNIKLAKRKIELMAFINYRGTISSSSAKEEFCKIFKSSQATISNMVSELTDLELLVKEKGKTKVTPNLRVDFSNDFVVRLFINTKEVSNGNQE